MLALLEKYTAMDDKGFSVDIETAADEWDACIKGLGAKNAYAAMANYLCGKYREKYGKAFLFSDACVANEIAYHVNAFMCMKHFPGYSRHISTYLLARDYLIEHCRTIEISTDDISSWRQKVMFKYRKGTRDCYKKAGRGKGR